MRRRELLEGTLAAAGLYTARKLVRPLDALAARTPQTGGQVVVGLSQEPTVFNPFRAHIEVDRGVHMCLFDALWKTTEGGDFAPNLATEIPTVGNGGISQDGLSYTVHLKRGITWHDGAPFTSRDVIFAWKLVMNPNFAAFSRTGYDQIETMTAPDAYTVKFRLKTPYAPLFALLSDTYFVPAHIYSQFRDLNHNSFDEHPIGTGPFRWGQRAPGDHISLSANKVYHGPGPYLDAVVFKYVPDLTVMFEQFKAGAIDVTGIQGITVDHYAEAKQLPNVTLYAKPSNFGVPQLKDLAVRQALYYAMDKDSIIKQIYYGVMRPAESYLGPSYWAFDPHLATHRYDPARANAILNEAGWAPGQGGIRTKNGVRLSFMNSTTCGNKPRRSSNRTGSRSVSTCRLRTSRLLSCGAISSECRTFIPRWRDPTSWAKPAATPTSCPSSIRSTFQSRRTAGTIAPSTSTLNWTNCSKRAS